jgi:hypothetical protein
LKIHLKNGNGYEVRARQGNMSEKAKPAAETAQRRIDDAMLSRQDVSEFPAKLQVALSEGKAPGRIEATVTVDPRQLRFLKKGDRSMQELTFAIVLENAAGEYVEGKQAVMDLALTPARLASMQATGIKASMTFAAAPGEYSLRAVVREAAQNRIATSSTGFKIR